MFWDVFKFEFKYQINQPAFYVISFFYFLLTFLATSSPNVAIGGAGGENLNSPYVIAQTILIMSIFGMFVVTAFVSNITLRDRDFKTSEIIFSTRMKKVDYLMGRFLGAFLVAFLAFSSVAWGAMLGSLMPWLDPERLNAFSFAPYFHALFFFALPGLFFNATLFFAVSTITRNMMLTYTAALTFLIMFFTGNVVFSDPEYRTILALMDPFGISSFEEETRYWTVFERNELLAPTGGLFLYSKMIWLSFSVVLLGLTYKIFGFDKVNSTFRLFKKKAQAEELTPPPQFHLAKLPTKSPTFGGSTTFSQFMALIKFEIGQVLKSVAFYIIMAFGIFNTVGALINVGGVFGTDVYPVTRMMINYISGTFSLVLIIVAIYYTAELVWRERQVKINEVLDATPAQNWSFVVAKMLGMLVVLMGLIGVSMLTAVIVQTSQGYTEFEIGMYMERLVLHFGFPFYLMAVLAIFLQVVSNNKYYGMMLMILYMVSTMVMNSLGLEHNLYQFASRPGAPMSDMNGSGHFREITVWFDYYWTFFSFILLTLGYLMWNRGTIIGWRGRMRQIRVALGPISAMLLIVALSGFVGTGAYIYYNTNVLNQYQTNDDNNDKLVAFENKFAVYDGKPQPRITDVKANVDIYPDTRSFNLEGSYIVENKTDEPITELHLALTPTSKLKSMSVEGATLVDGDDNFQYYIYGFEAPLLPGASIKVSFETYLEPEGFKNSGNNNKVQYNGTFFNNYDVMPVVGYSQRFILADKNERRKRGLVPIDRAPKLDDMVARKNSYLSTFADWVTFETVVSTNEDQIAISPGYIEREWVEGGRRYFHYKMDKPIQNFVAWLSADYTVKTGKWNDVDISVYHHGPHNYNVDRMIESVQKSLDYFSAEFSPYQYKQMRVLEFPDYARFAQSFPNTVPYSEGIGFIADLSDQEAIDYVFYITAHEVAHQWWAHQVMGANTQGGQVLVETLAQYSALMVMEKEYGPELMRRFLKYELDTYLTNRGNEAIEEMPLMLVENQGYIHYRKGSMVMYALKDYLGEDLVNEALQILVERHAYQHNPYPVSTDLIDILRELAPEPEQQALITDLFEKIILYDLRVDEPNVTELDDGTYKVNFNVDALKFEATGKGAQTELPVDIALDIGVFSKNPDEIKPGDDYVLYLEKHQITGKTTAIELIVQSEPSHVGVDPFVKLIDRDSADNIGRLQSEDAEVVVAEVGK